MMVMAPPTNVKLVTPGSAPAQGVMFHAKSAVALVNERRIEFVHARNVRVIGKIDEATGKALNTGSESLPKKKVLVESDAIERLLAWKHSRKIGPGFANLGNTCYLNSVLQCLSYTPSFAQYLLEKDVLAAFATGNSSAMTKSSGGKHQLHSSSSSTMAKNAHGFCGVRVMCRLLQSVHGASAARVLQPKEVVMNIRHVSKSFRIGRQEDSHEFFRLLLDSMQRSCLRRAHIKAESHPAAATTLVHRTFRGQLKNSLKCAKCHFVSERLDDFLDLSLEITNGIKSVRGALKHFTAVETLDDSNAWKCASCKQLNRAEKGLTIETCPNVLVIQLKRFDIMFGKIKKHVEFPTALDLAPGMSKTSDDRKRGRCKYELHAVLVHAGYSTDCGHYYAFVKGSSGQWYEMNDESVRWVSLDTVLQQKAYMLFYSRVLPVSERPQPKAKAPATAATSEPSASSSTSGAKSSAEEIPVKVAVAATAAKPKDLDMNGFLASLKTNITSVQDTKPVASVAAAIAPQHEEVESKVAAVAAPRKMQVLVTFNVTKRRAPSVPTTKRAVTVPVFGGRIGRFYKYGAAAWRSNASGLEMTRGVAEYVATVESEAAVRPPAPAAKLTVEDVVAATSAAVAPQVAPAKVTKVHFDPRQLKNIGVKSAALFGKSVDKWNETNGWADDVPAGEGGDDAADSAAVSGGASELERELAAQHDRVMNKLKNEDWKHRNAARQDYWDETLDAGKIKKVKKRKDFVANQGASNKFQLKLQHKKQRH